MRSPLVFLSFLVLAPLASANSQDDGKKAVAAVVKNAVEKVLVVLKMEDLSRIQKRERVMTIIKPIVDFELMARRSLPSKMWSSMNVKQRATFTELFTETIKRSYFEKLALFTDEIVEFDEPLAKKTKKPAYSLVTHVFSKGDRIEVVYALTQTRDEEKKQDVWKVYDFEIEGVSLRSSYRSQYRDFLEDRTLEDLLEAMRRKIDTAKKKEAEVTSGKKAEGKARELKLLGHYDRIVLGHPRVAVTCLLALFAFFGFWIKDFQLDASSDSLVLENDDDLRYSRVLARRYGGDEFVLVTYTPSEDLFSAESLERLKRLRDEITRLERVASVVTILDVPLLRNPPVPLAQLKENLKTLEHPDADVELARAEFRTSPVYKNLLVSTDMKSTALQVNFRVDEEHVNLTQRRSELLDRRVASALTVEEAAELDDVESSYTRSKNRLRAELHEDIASIRNVLAGYRQGTELFLGGVPMIVNDIVAFIRSDLRTFGVGMVLLLTLTLGLIFRRLRWVILPVLCCGCSVLVMMGLLGFLGWEVTVVSSNFVSLQLIFTMSLTIHLIVRYRELLREQPDEDNRVLIRNTVRLTFVPCLYASLTTIAGFSSLILCDILPVETFGWMMTLGIVVSLVVTFLLFPAALSQMRKPPAERENDFGLPTTSWFAGVTERRGTTILVLSVLVTGATVVGATQLEVENSFIDYFKKSTEIYRGMEFIDRELGGTTPLEITLDFEPAEKGTDEIDELDELYELDELEEADDPETYWYTTTKFDRIVRVHDYLGALPATGKVMSLGTLWKLGLDINQGEPLETYEIAILFQRLSDDVKNTLIKPYVCIDENQVRINVRIKDSDENLRRNALIRKIKSDLREELGLKEDQFRVGGLMVLYNNMLQSLFQSQIKTIGYTVLALMAMFLLLFRSLKICIIAIFPSLLASLVVIGVMGLGGFPLDVMTITIVAISIGIAVDDTIHYLHRFRREFEKDRDYVQTMHRCHRSIGNAMFYTSITITFGFSILAISNFVPSILFGLLTALAMMMALVSALSLLPRLIFLLEPFGREA